MTGALLDTSVLIAAGFLDLPPAAAISVISLGELRAGVLLARSDQVRAARQARLDALRVFAPLDVDEAVASLYGEILATARAEGRTTKATDLLIAATAAAHGRTLYTLDDRQAALARAANVPVETP